MMKRKFRKIVGTQYFVSYKNDCVGTMVFTPICRGCLFLIGVIAGWRSGIPTCRDECKVYVLFAEYLV